MSLPTHLTLEIVTPDRALVHEDVDEVQLPGTEGYLGILPGHTPLLTSLRVGPALVPQGHREVLPVGGLRVRRGPAGPRPPARADRGARGGNRRHAGRGAPAPAEETLQAATAGNTDIDLDRARISLMKAMVRLQVAAEGPPGEERN